LLFALSRFGLHPTFNLCHVAFFGSLHGLCFYGFFNGGNFRTATRFRAASTFPFCTHIIFSFSPSRITFCHFTIFYSPTGVACRITSVSNSLRLLFSAE
jgi:hypothetical protein